MNTPQEIYRQIVGRLDALRKKRKLIRIFSGIVFLIGLICLTFSISLIVESVFHFQVNGRIFIDIFVILVVVAGLVKYVGYPLFSLIWRRNDPHPDQLALIIGEKFPAIKDQLANAMQIYANINANSEGYSADLIEAALLKIDRQVKTIDFKEVIDYSSLKKSARFTGVFAFSFLFLTLLFFSHFTAAAERLLNPATAFQTQNLYEFVIEPGNVKLKKGKDLHISAKIKNDEFIENAYLRIKNLVSGVTNEWFLPANSEGSFQYTIEHVTDSLEYAIRIHNQTSPVYKVSIFELPLIRNIQIKLSFPEYTKLSPRFLDENVGDIVALKGSRAALTIQSNKLLDSARVQFSNRQSLALAIQSNEATGNFRLTESTDYSIQIVDRELLKNENPINYQIDVLEDSYPTVKITAPAEDVDVTGDMRLILMAEAEDDFGFSSARVNYQVVRQNQPATDSWQIFPVAIKNLKIEKISFDYDWELNTLQLKPSDWVQYNIEVFDNDLISGPKSTKSLNYTLRYPSLNEMYDEMDHQQERADNNLEQIHQESQELKEKMNEIVEALKKDPKVSWEEKKNIEAALETQEKMLKKLEDIQKNLDEMMQRTEKNDLLSLETLEKYQELQELFEEMATPEMKKAMEDLQKALENFDPKQLQRAMEKMEFNQESFLKNLERTISLLKRLQIEQKIDEIIKKAEALAQRQNELNEQAEKAPPEKGKDLARDQQKIRSDTEDLQQQLEKLMQKMAEFPDMPLPEVQQAKNKFEDSAPLAQMKQVMQKFQQGEMEAGAQQGQKMQQTLQDLASMLSQAKQQMMQQQQQAAMEAMRRSARELLNLSKGQETLMNRSKSTSATSPRMNELAEKQLNLMKALSRTIEDLLALSQKSMAVTPEMGRELGKSVGGMKKSLTALEGRNGSSAGKSQAQAMGSLNEAVRQLRNSMNNMANSSCGSGMQQFMEQLKAASGKQQGLNMQTQQLGEQGRLSMGQQAALARLAAEQQQLQKTLEQLAKEAASGAEILGRLDETAREMGEVAKELAQNPQVQAKTIQRQQRILSRLLDAQRSMQTRDFSKKRESKKGKNYLPRRVAGLPRDLGEQQMKIQQDLLKALKEGYSRDYKELIKKYFDALSRGMVERDESKTIKDN